jgi:hypothetical protein
MTCEEFRALAAYLLRDTIKVIGCEDLGLAPADFGIFYVRASDPMKGGTGHTIRVCRERGVPVLTQDQWMSWLGGDQRVRMAPLVYRLRRRRH